MKVKDLFNIYQGNSFELMNMELSNISNVNFVSRTASDNGVVAQVCEDSTVKPFPSGYITVALGGSVLSSFVQSKPFYTAFHIAVLQPKNEMTLQKKLYFCLCIKENAYRYTYGRQANKTLKNIELPDEIPAWVNETPIKPIKTKIRKEILPPLNITSWKEYRIGALFTLERCKCSAAGDLADGEGCYYLGAKKSENGVMRRVAYEEDLISKGNCVVFIGDGQGSVGYTNYMNNDFIGTINLTVGYNKYLNKYTGMFIVTLLDLERKKYSFGRKWAAKIADSTIKLPADAQGSPDWGYMEKYIKHLPFADKI